MRYVGIATALLLCFAGDCAQRFANAAGTTSTATLMPLRVMSYNIRYGTADDGLDRWEVRKPRLFDVLHRHKPELIGLQEALVGQVDDLRAAFPDYHLLGVGRNDGRTSGEFAAIMYNENRLQALRSDTFWMSDTPDIPASKHWGNNVVRICTWAHFRDLQTGRFFYVFNTHLDHESQPSREKSAQLILSRIAKREPKDRVILTGDFNVDESNTASLTIRQAGFIDTFRVLHPEATEVGTSNAFKEHRELKKIDYIYVDQEWTVQEAEIVPDKVDGRWPSDHLPVTAVLSM